MLNVFGGPSTIWSYGHDPEAGALLGRDPPPPQLPFRWLHLNLADQRSLHWLGESGLPPALIGLLQHHEAPAGLIMVPGGIGLAVSDFEHGLPHQGAGRIGLLYVAVTDGMIVTGRVRPLHSADLVHERLVRGLVVESPSDALAFLLGTMIDSFASLILDLNTELIEVENEVMADADAPDTRELVAARRRSAQIHKLTGSLRATLLRIEAEPTFSAPLRAVPHELLPRLTALDADIATAQQQLRLLRDELDLQTAQRTNRNVYILSILTAIMMPATLVTGFFGMNTGGLPLVRENHGTAVATLVAVLSALTTYWLLRRMGFFQHR
jgi:Mg2+ and Co2+ transporter CorA